MRPVASPVHEQAAELLKALANPWRLAIIDQLRCQPRCVHELTEALGMSQPLVSQHLRILRAGALVRGERRGREMVYSIADDHITHIVADALTHVAEPSPQPTPRKAHK